MKETIKVNNGKLTHTRTTEIDCVMVDKIIRYMSEDDLSIDFDKLDDGEEPPGDTLDYSSKFMYKDCVTLHNLGILEKSDYHSTIDFDLEYNYEVKLIAIRRDMNIDSIIEE